MEIIKAESLIEDEQFVPRWIIIGESGSGKTTALTTWPEDMKLLHFDFWGNKESLVGAKNIDIVTYTHMDPIDPTTYIQVDKDSLEAESQLRSGRFPYSGISYDAITGLGDLMLYNVLGISKASGESMAKGVGGSPTEAHYRGLAHIMSTFLKRIMAFPIHMIVIAHVEATEKRESDGATHKAVVWGKRTRSTLYTYFSEVYRSFSQPSEEKMNKFGEPDQEFLWQTKPDLDWPMLKSVLNQRGKYWGTYVEPDFKKLLTRRGLYPLAKEVKK